MVDQRARPDTLRDLENGLESSIDDGNKLDAQAAALLLVPHRCRLKLGFRVGQDAKSSLHRPSWLSTRARTSLHSGAGSPLF